MFNNILLDFDGTVFDTGEGITRSVRYALEKFGIESELSDLYCFCGPPLLDMFMEKYGMSEEQARRAVGYYRERYSATGWRECRVYPGIREMTAHLRAQGRKVAIATSKPTAYAVKIMAEQGMEKDFDLIMGCEMDGTHSAKWEVIEAAMCELHAYKDDTVMAGDRKYDVIGAHRCGIPCIGVSYGYAEPEEFEKAGADYVAADAQELCKLIEAYK